MQSSCLLKIFEMYLLDYLSEKIFFNHRQFGFMKGMSTTHSCFLLKEIINQYSTNDGKTYTCFVDFSKAFDRVNHYKLGVKLIERNIPPDLVILIINYLKNQKACVKWGNSSSSYCTVDVGVRQGGILSPFLFKLYIDDILNDMTKLNTGCCLGISRLNILAYADDMVIISNSHRSLDILFSKFKIYVDKLDLVINRQKSKCMIFSSKKVSYLNNIRSVILDNDNFEVVDSFKYLGNFLTYNLDNSLDIEYKMNNFYKSFYSMIRNFNCVNIQTILFIFNSFCLPTYGLALWNEHNLTKRSAFRSFETTFSNSLKNICHVPKFASSHVVADLCDTLLLNHIVNKNKLNFYINFNNTRNDIFVLNSAFLRNGLCFNDIFNVFKQKYNVNIDNNDIRALYSRISYIQKNEDRSFCRFFNV